MKNLITKPALLYLTISVLINVVKYRIEREQNTKCDRVHSDL